jgi:F-type H+-transporting ATPase subunit epsilon
MNADCFQLEINTPLRVGTLEIRALRLEDATGCFGIKRGHCDFLSVLVPALGSYIDPAGGEHFLAVDGGIFCMRNGLATITAGEVFEGDDAGRLAETIGRVLTGRDSAERAVSQMVEGIENSFLKKMSALRTGGG